MSTITTIAAGDAISGSRATINTNFSNLNTDKMETSVLDTDTSLTANSDLKVATQKAVKTYVDAGGNVNASETAKGIVEEATDAEVTAGTATGGTGAKLFVTPTKLATRLSTLAVTPIVQIFTASGTWTKPASLKYVVVEVVGGGGGGAAGTDEGATGKGGGGGGGGGYSRKIVTAASLGATETVTVGAATATSSFGTHATATGGANGSGRVGGTGGVGSSGNINSGGSDGATAEASVTGPVTGGQGGSTILGGGGTAGYGPSSNGNAGKSYGGGGGGGGASDSGVMGTGGAGASGVVIVTEFY